MGEHEPLMQQIDAALTPEADKDSRVVIVNGDLLTIDGRRYRLVKDHRNAFDVARLNERYNEILDKYDYIVGDWGYDQLRLRGFYKDDRRGVSKDQLIGTLEDYLYEYCNFGCAYFVIERIGGKKEKSTQRRRKKKNQGRAYIDEKKVPVASNHKKPVIKKRNINQTNKETVKPKVNTAKPKSNTNFTIRQREE